MEKKLKIVENEQCLDTAKNKRKRDSYRNGKLRPNMQER